MAGPVTAQFFHSDANVRAACHKRCYRNENHEFRNYKKRQRSHFRRREYRFFIEEGIAELQAEHVELAAIVALEDGEMEEYNEWYFSHMNILFPDVFGGSYDYESY